MKDRDLNASNEPTIKIMQQVKANTYIVNPVKFDDFLKAVNDLDFIGCH
jgi:hypothetical protein